MGDPFKIWSAGEAGAPGEGPFSAEWHNAVTRVTRANQREASPGLNTKEVEVPRDPDIWLANISEAPISRFSAVGIGGFAIYPAATDCEFNERLCFFSARTLQGQPFGIVQEPIGAGQLYLCKTAAGPGGQPPNIKWLRLIGSADLWDATETYNPGEQALYIAAASAWVDAQNYVAGDRVAFSGVVYVCIAPHTASSGNEPPDATYWSVDAGKVYASLQANAGKTPPAYSAYWQQVGAHKSVWARADTYAVSDVIVLPQLGRVFLDGISRAQVSMALSTHTYADIQGGALVSQADPGPLEIIRRAGSWCAVRFCCSDLETPSFTGSGSKPAFGAMTIAGTGTYIFRPGGALHTSPMTSAGVGTFVGPTYTGSGSPAFKAMQSSGVGHSYNVPPSGRLFMGPMSIAGVGTRTTPPAGRGSPSFVAMTMTGIGTHAAPVRTGSGTPALASMTISGTGTAKATSFDTAPSFVAAISDPLYISGHWLYDWVEQVIDPDTGEFADGSRSGTAESGPPMRELNNNLVDTPLNVEATYRGVYNGQPVYYFADCCTLDSDAGYGSLTMGAMTMAGVGAFSFAVRPPAGNLQLAGSVPAIGQAVNPPVGNLQLDGFAPTASGATIVAPPVGNLQLDGFAPTIGEGVSPAVGNLQLDGFAPTVSPPYVILPPAGNLQLDGFAPTISAGSLWTVEYGTVNGQATPGTFTPSYPVNGVTAALISVVDESTVLSAATAYRDIGTTNNSLAITFTMSAELSTPDAYLVAGVRWTAASDNGWIAVIVNSTLYLKKSTFATLGSTTAGASLSLTNGNSYTLQITDAAGTITASIADDSSTKTQNVTDSSYASNTNILFGWFSTNHATPVTFATPITGIS